VWEVVNQIKDFSIPEYSGLVSLAILSSVKSSNVSDSSKSDQISQLLNSLEFNLKQLKSKKPQQIKYHPYEAAISSFLSLGMFDDARDILERMKQNGAKPRYKTYSLFFDHFLRLASQRKKNDDKHNFQHNFPSGDVVTFLESMKMDGLIPTTPFYNKVLAIIMNDEVGNKFAWQILENASKKYFIPNGVTFDLIIRASSDYQQVNDACGLMFAFGFQWNRNTWTALAERYASFSDWKTVLTLANDPYFQSSDEFFNVLISLVSVERRKLSIGVVFSALELCLKYGRRLSNRSSALLISRLRDQGSSSSLQRLWNVLNENMTLRTNFRLLTRFINAYLELGGTIEIWWPIVKDIKKRYDRIPFKTQTLILDSVVREKSLYSLFQEYFKAETKNEDMNESKDAEMDFQNETELKIEFATFNKKNT
jgi:pentatricopeptide repeat protein